MKLLHGKYEIGKILEDGSVLFDPRAVTAAPKERPALPYDPAILAPDEPYLAVPTCTLVSPQALAGHRHEYQGQSRLSGVLKRALTGLASWL